MEKIVIVMEGGMTFKLEAEEEEPVTWTIPEGANQEPYRRYISGPLQFLDGHDNERPQLVLDHPYQRWLRDDARDAPMILKCYFRCALGHGLSAEELNHCIQQFTNLIHGLFNSHSPYSSIINDISTTSINVRRFVFKIERRGFWRSPYLARALAASPEEAIMCCPLYAVNALDSFEHAKFLVEDENEECPICFEDFGRGSEAAQLQCRHYFHRPCIARWVFVRYTCPCCRFALVPKSTGRYNHHVRPTCWLYPPQGILLDLHMP